MPKRKKKRIVGFTWTMSAGRFRPYVRVKGFEPILGKPTNHISDWGSPEVEKIMTTLTPKRRTQLKRKWKQFSSEVNRLGYDLMERNRFGEVTRPLQNINEIASLLTKRLKKKFGRNHDIFMEEYK